MTSPFPDTGLVERLREKVRPGRYLMRNGNGAEVWARDASGNTLYPYYGSLPDSPEDDAWDSSGRSWATPEYDLVRWLGPLTGVEGAPPALTTQQQEPVGEVKRYDFVKMTGSVTLLPAPRDDGEWVKFADYQRAIEERDAYIRGMETGIKSIEAAAEARISTLEAQLVEAREALKPFTRRAPVLGFSAGIPWDMHLRAYDVYCKRYSPQKALIEGGCRGGFSTGELDMFIPGWRQEVAEDFRRVRNAALNTGGAG